MDTRDKAVAKPRPFNASRRQLLAVSAATAAGAAGALVLGVSFRVPAARAQGAPAATPVQPGTRVSAFIEIRPDGTVFFRSPFVEGGQGVDTALTQVVAEELDVLPQHFTVSCAPPGPDYLVMNGRRVTGGSNSVRSSYETMRRLGASARAMLLQAAAAELGVAVDSLSTEPGKVIHAASGRTLDYGALAAKAATLPVPAQVALRAEKDFRWIGKPVPRLDARDKSTGRIHYTIDLKVDNMLHAAVQHAPRLGGEAERILNEAQVRAMPGVHSVHRLPGAVAVVADRWWRAHKAVRALQVQWIEPPPTAGSRRVLPEFSSEQMRRVMAAAPGSGIGAEARGDVHAALREGDRLVEATYDAPYLAHATMEPPSTIARWNSDGSLELWLPNQAPEMFQAAVAKLAGIDPTKVMIHSPPVGGFFGRHFLYPGASPYPQAMALAKAVGQPVKVIWSREEEFLRDALRPMGLVRFRAALDAKGLPLALEAEVVGEGPVGFLFGRKPETTDRSAMEGVAGKRYAIPNLRLAQVPLEHPVVIGFWRSVGHSMNDFFYEAFFDEMADAGGMDPFELRMRLLDDEFRLKDLLQAVGELSGGWKRGPFTAADGSRRARGVAMTTCFGSEVATIAEVSIRNGEVVVHDVWVAIDPGSIVNPAIIEAQVASAVALGLSETLVEEHVYVDGAPRARNFDGYPILRHDMMPRVHVRIVLSDAPMGGIGEPGLPAVPPAVVNAVAALTGQRVRSLPLSKVKFPQAVA